MEYRSGHFSTHYYFLIAGAGFGLPGHHDLGSKCPGDRERPVWDRPLPESRSGSAENFVNLHGLDSPLDVFRSPRDDVEGLGEIA